MIQNRPPVVASGPQPYQPDESLSGLGKAGLVATGLAAAGFIPTGSKRVWDYYLRGIRAWETSSPMAVMRTFRVSETLSPLESWKNIPISQDQIQSKTVYGSFLQKTLGRDVEKATLERTGHLFGEVKDVSGKVIGYGLNVSAGTQRGAAIIDYAARIKKVPLEGAGGVSIAEGFLRTKHALEYPHLNWEEFRDTVARVDPELASPRIPLVARLREELNVLGKTFKLTEEQSKYVARAEVGLTFMRAKTAATVGRLNTLLQKPFELPIIGDYLKKIPLVNKLAIEPGTATQMATRYLGRGLMIGGIWKGLEYYDYLRAQESPTTIPLGTAIGAGIGGFLFKNTRRSLPFSPRGMAVGAAIGLYTALAPRFNHGLFYGAASYFTDANVIRAKVSEFTGLSDSLRQQEAVTPGLLSLKTAIGFTGVGALFGGTIGYGSLMGKAIKQTLGPEGATKGFSRIVDELRQAAPETFGAKVRPILNKIPFLGEKLASKIKSPAMLGAVAGLGIWAAASTILPIMSGNFMASIPGVNLLGTQETPEQLQAIYSGVEEVPVRKGRYWEMGRCLLQHTEITTQFGSCTEAKDIRVSDKLLSSDGYLCDILTIWERAYSGLSYNIYSVLDKNIPTAVTGNHKIPVLTKEQTYDFEVIEKEARCINVGEYVQVPIPQLPNTTKELISENLIKTGLFLLDNQRVLPAQKNWYSGKIQRSRGFGIPKIVQLTPELGRLFGYYLAEGNLSFTKDAAHVIEVVFAKHERWIVDDFISICEKEFNITPTVRLKTTGKKAKEGCWIVRICNALLARVFFELFYKSNRQQDKMFPQIFMEASQDFKEQLIEGYWRGDGCLEGSTKILSSCRKEFITKSQIILLNLGYFPTIDRFESNDFRGRYKLRWNQNKQYTGRGFHNNFRLYNDRLYAKVIAITIEEYDGSVYDFEIDHPDHLFQAGTFLVHNSSDYSGGRILYYRPHFMARLKERAYQKGVWGSEEEKWGHDPILHPVKALIGSDEWKYAYEYEHMYDRPAPLTSTYGENIPFVGPIVAATFGKLLKPRKYIRPEEWMLPEGGYKPTPTRPELEPAYDLGGLPPGAPVAPEDLTQLFNELMYRRREAIGLPGFVEGALENAVTGREEVFRNLQTMETMGKETGSEYWLWQHLQLGGAALASEPVRRFIPHERSYLQKYNPLEADMPSWFPKNYFVDLEHGNPFKDLPEAELRMPGEGYAAMHPELEGVDPERYPLLHRLKILSDVGMWSPEYKTTLREAMANRDQMTDEELYQLQTVRDQVREKKKRRWFNEYQFTGKGDVEGFNALEETAGTLWEGLSRAAETPLELLTPMSPASKFIRQRTAIEEYAASEAIGTGSAFWDRPIENFIRPMADVAAYKLGRDTIPAPIQRERAIKQYFDVLQYVKQGKLLEQAQEEGRNQDVLPAIAAQRRTMFGLNVFAAPPQIMTALPREERDFFSEFSQAETPEEREAIMKLVPPEERRVYMAQWMRQSALEARQRQAEGQSTKRDDEILAMDQVARVSEGRPYDEQLYKQWQDETGGKISFAEWMRQRELAEYSKTRTFPDASWIAWSPAVDLKDVEAKYLQNENLDHHDYDIWGEQVDSLARKPYIDRQVLNSLASSDELAEKYNADAYMYRNAKMLGRSMKSSSSDIIVSKIGADIGDRYDIDIKDGREDLVNSTYKEMGFSRYGR